VNSKTEILQAVTRLAA